MRTWVTIGVVVVMFLLCAGLISQQVCMIRDAAARIRCQNSLYQIIMAVNNYHDTNNAFPAATHPNPNLPPEERLSWMADLLPFMECDNLYFRLDKEKPWNCDANHDVVVEVEKSYLCASNPNLAAKDSPALTHYVGIAGLGVDAATLPLEDLRAGCFGYDRTVTRKDMKRGTGFTVVVMETTNQNGPWAAGGFSTVRGLDPDNKPYLGQNQQFGIRHLQPILFQSNSTCTVALADGSVRCLYASLSTPATLEVLVTLGGPGEVGDDF
jgi:hypothetical protein